MSINRIQFQTGMSMPEFLKQFGTEAQCASALEQSRWPQGFVCPCCGETGCSVSVVGVHKMFQCRSCRHQTSLTAGTLFQSTKLPLTTWFLAIYLVSQAKTGLSALALKRYLGVRYPTAWLIQHKLMQAMSERETRYTLSGPVQVDDAYLGGELNGGKAGRGSENKVPFVAAVSLDDNGHPLRIKLTPVTGFTLKAISSWAKANLAPNCSVSSDGLACFAAVAEAGCQHNPLVVGERKPKELPELLWINTVLGNLKTSLGGSYHAFDFAKYASRYLAAFAYRFNRRFQLDTLPMRLLVATVSIGPRPADWLRLAEASS
jgi:transposase-like protein